MSAVQQKAAAVGGAAPAASLPWLRADAGPGLITVGGFAAQAEDLPGAWSRPRGRDGRSPQATQAALRLWQSDAQASLCKQRPARRPGALLQSLREACFALSSLCGFTYLHLFPTSPPNRQEGSPGPPDSDQRRADQECMSPAGLSLTTGSGSRGCHGPALQGRVAYTNLHISGFGLPLHPLCFAFPWESELCAAR